MHHFPTRSPKRLLDQAALAEWTEEAPLLVGRWQGAIREQVDGFRLIRELDREGAHFRPARGRRADRVEPVLIPTFPSIPREVLTLKTRPATGSVASR